MAKIDDIVSSIKELSVLEVSDLVKLLEEEFGVSAAAPVAVASSAAAGDTAAAAEEKDDFNVVITASGDNKINVIKALRGIQPELGLKEAKDLVDNLPATIAESVATDAAKEMEKTLTEAGATVELQ